MVLGKKSKQFTNGVLRKVLFIYITWCIESSLTLKTENSSTETLTYNFSSPIVMTWCLLTLTYVWSFFGIFEPVVWFFFIPDSYIQRCVRSFVRSLVARHFTRRWSTGLKQLSKKKWITFKDALEWVRMATLNWLTDFLTNVSKKMQEMQACDYEQKLTFTSHPTCNTYSDVVYWSS